MVILCYFVDIFLCFASSKVHEKAEVPLPPNVWTSGARWVFPHKQSHAEPHHNSFSKRTKMDQGRSMWRASHAIHQAQTFVDHLRPIVWRTF